MRQDEIEKLARQECDNDYDDTSIWDTLPDDNADDTGRNYYRRSVTQDIEKLEALGWILPVPDGERREKVAKLIETTEGSFCAHDVLLTVADSILALTQPTVPELPLLTDKLLQTLLARFFFAKSAKKFLYQFTIEDAPEFAKLIAQAQRDLCLEVLRGEKK